MIFIYITVIWLINYFLSKWKDTKSKFCSFLIKKDYEILSEYDFYKMCFLLYIMIFSCICQKLLQNFSVEKLSNNMGIYISLIADSG